MERPSAVPEIIDELLGQKETVTAGEVAAHAGVTRQAAHRHLARLVSAGELALEGHGRGARYRRVVDFAETYGLTGLEEDRVWRELLERLPPFGERPNARGILNYAFTEMLNNAIEHSRGTRVRVLASARPGRDWFEVSDDGVGVFANLQERFRLPDNVTAIQELSKGKATSDPDHHSGQGIFFASKLVDVFQLESGGTTWTVDNVRGDQAIGSAPPGTGTRVRCSLDPATGREAKNVFDHFSEPRTYEFDTTTVAVRLFEPEGSFVSRSEAKRVASRLEGFRAATIDFAGVDSIGQAFADELFRVWAQAHPETTLIPINTIPEIQALIRRAQSTG